MTEAKKPRTAAARRKPAAARAEVTDTTPRIVDFRGLSITCPKPEDWPGELYFLLADLEDDENSVAASMKVLKALVGAEQFSQVRAKLAEDGVKFADVEGVLSGLAEQVMGAYGTTTGESKASPGS